MNAPPAITDADLGRLDAFLLSDATPDSAMDVSTLEGFLTALVIGPNVALPSAWMPWVWDFESGMAGVVYESMEQAQAITGLLMGLMNRIADAFHRDPESFEPVFYRQAVWGAAEWCEGFLKATVTFDDQAWAGLWAMDALDGLVDDDRIRLVTPFLRLGEPEGIEITKQQGDVQRLVDAVVPSLVAIHAHWLAQRQLPPAAADFAAHTPVRRAGPKVGRNEPCPCGSGRKYKKCCGVAPTLH